MGPTNFAILLDDGNTLDNFGKGKCGAKYSNLDLNGSLKLSVVKKMSYSVYQGNKTPAPLCIGDAIVIITLVKFAVFTLVIVVKFFSLLIKLFFEAKAPKTAL